MAGELQLAHGVSGRTLYAVVRNTAGQVWNGTSFEAYNASNWATYDIALTEQSTSGYYVGNFPAVAAGVYPVEVRHQSGGGPAVGDTVVGDGAIDWTGSAVAGVKDGVDANVVEWLGTGVIVSQDAVPVVSVGWFADPNDSYAGQVLSYSAGNGVPDVNVKRWNFQTVQNIGVEVLRGIANRYGDIQGATSTTVTLDNGARPTDGFYVGMIVDFNGSTLFSGQPRVITGYVGATRVATVDSAWTSTPTAGTGFYLFENSVYVNVPTAVQNADALLGRNLAGGSDGGRTVRDSLRAGRNRIEFDQPAAGQFTVYAEDDITPAWTGTYTRGANTLGPLTATNPV